MAEMVVGGVGGARTPDDRGGVRAPLPDAPSGVFLTLRALSGAAPYRPITDPISFACNNFTPFRAADGPAAGARDAGARSRSSAG